MTMICSLGASTSGATAANRISEASIDVSSFGCVLPGFLLHVRYRCPQCLEEALGDFRQRPFVERDAVQREAEARLGVAEGEGVSGPVTGGEFVDDGDAATQLGKRGGDEEGLDRQ